MKPYFSQKQLNQVGLLFPPRYIFSSAMNLRSLITRRLISLSFSSSSTLRNVSGLASTWIRNEEPRIANWERDSTDVLYRRISPECQQVAVVTPLLDQWVKEGRSLSSTTIFSVIRKLRKYRYYKHALEVLNWAKLRNSNTAFWSGFNAIQLDLISKVHGTEEADKFFSKLPKECKTYSALLNCYAQEMLVDKAEALWLEMKDIGFSRSTLAYSSMLNLYSQLGNHVKLDNLLQEMEREGVMLDSIAYGLLLSVPGRNSDADGIKKIIDKAESDNMCELDSTFYMTAANLYLKAGELNKGVECLRKAESILTFKNKKVSTFLYLLTLYGTAGRTDDVWRIWKLCKVYKVYYRDYTRMIRVMLKLNELEGAEKVVEEYWESAWNLNHDMSLPNRLIAAYCRNGLVEKAKSVMKRQVLNGLQPNSFTWFWLAEGYVQMKRMAEAVEAVKSAVVACTPYYWKPTVEPLVVCLNYLIEEKDKEAFGGLTDLLVSKGFVSEDLRRKLLVVALDGGKVDDEMKEEFGARLWIEKTNVNEVEGNCEFR